MKKHTSELDLMLEQLDSGEIKDIKLRIREYVGLENAIKLAKMKKKIIIAMSRRRKKLESELE